MESTTDDLRGLHLNADEEEDEEDQAVFLAFVREPDGPEELQRHRFPSKAGGSPAWLDPVHLPTGDSRLCGEPLRLALQVSAPLPPPAPADGAEHHDCYYADTPDMPPVQTISKRKRDQLAPACVG